MYYKIFIIKQFLLNDKFYASLEFLNYSIIINDITEFISSSKDTVKDRND